MEGRRGKKRIPLSIPVHKVQMPFRSVKMSTLSRDTECIAAVWDQYGGPIQSYVLSQGQNRDLSFSYPYTENEETTLQLPVSDQWCARDRCQVLLEHWAGLLSHQFPPAPRQRHFTSSSTKHKASGRLRPESSLTTFSSTLPPLSVHAARWFFFARRTNNHSRFRRNFVEIAGHHYKSKGPPHFPLRRSAR